MTKQEFLARQKNRLGPVNKRAALWLVALLAILFACLPLTHYLERQEESLWLIPVCAGGLALFFSGSLALVNWYARHQQRGLGVPCPHCGKPLHGIGAQIALATGNCGYCGKKVISEEESE